MITPALYHKLQAAFTKHANFHAPRWDVDAGDFEGWMWEVLLAKGAGVIHQCGPLFDQTPAYIATWAARYAAKRVQREWRAESLDESLPCPERRAYTYSSETFSDFLERMGAEWGIDTSEAVDAVQSGEVSPAFEAYIRSLTPQDKRIAALLLSGIKASHIKADTTRTPYRIRRDMIQALKKAA
jgi:hypothetical protein